VTESSQIYTDIDRIGWFFNLMGFLVKEKIVHIKLVDELLGYWVIKNWETIKPLSIRVEKAVQYTRIVSLV
jgi:hypothetical protein